MNAAPASLALDERQRAMLAEMGVRVWAPLADAPPTPSPEPAFVARAAQPVQVPVPTPLVHAAPAVTGRTPARSRPEGVDVMDWAALRGAVAGCQACKLCEGRTKTVFGVGDERADWLIVGEAPGEHEDLQGEPFVGQAGKLLDNMLKALGLDRQHKVFIANVLKCRPPGNRTPSEDELMACRPYLLKQIEMIKPRLIVALGGSAAKTLLQQTDVKVGELRGQIFDAQGIPLVVTYHPSYLLRSPMEKAKAWEDLCFMRRTMRSLKEQTSIRPDS